MSKKLSDTLTGGIYQYHRTDNSEVVYRGSTEHIKDKWGEPLQKVDDWHRKGETFNVKFKYSWTVFRTALRTPFGEKLEISWVHQPKEMTREELLTLEGECIRKAKADGQCYLNHDPDPLKTWKKYNEK
jgi:hypothetical protein